MTAAVSDNPQLLAGEYVLGTLDLAERQAVDAERRRNHELDAAIGVWERLFAPLVVAIAPIAPRQGLYPGIARRLNDGPPASGARDSDVKAAFRPSAVVSANLPSVDAGRVVRLTRSLRAWKTATALVGTLAASLLIGIGLSGPPPSSGRTFVAVLQQEAGTPAFLVSVDSRSRTMTVRPVKTEAQSDKSYELWLVSNKFDKVPKSLGLIGEGPLTIVRGVGNFDRTVLEDATYAVSVEPRGGSPKSVATGPVLWTGRLVQAIP